MNRCEEKNKNFVSVIAKNRNIKYNKYQRKNKEKKGNGKSNRWKPCSCTHTHTHS